MSVVTTAAVKAKRFITGYLRGMREARRCGIEGAAARTVSRTLVGRIVGIGLEPVRDPRVEARLEVVRGAHAGRSRDVARERSSRVQHSPQLTDRVVQPGPRGPDGDAQGLRDLRQRVPQVVVQDDDRPLFR